LGTVLTCSVACANLVRPLAPARLIGPGEVGRARQVVRHAVGTAHVLAAVDRVACAKVGKLTGALRSGLRRLWSISVDVGKYFSSSHVINNIHMFFKESFILESPSYFVLFWVVWTRREKTICIYSNLNSSGKKRSWY
jgi:hypothetical protein